MYYVYILKCVDNKPYTGCTDNLKERLERHKNGHVPATKERRPLKLDAYFAFRDKYKAFKFEKYLKSGSGRAFIKNILYKNCPPSPAIAGFGGQSPLEVRKGGKVILWKKNLQKMETVLLAR